jgi:phenylpyruvate tautomerase PptA (4-oxalocrotonate tautomerase family)
MPLIRVDMTEGGSPDEIKALLDATHRTLVSVFKIPQRDRYQIVHEHPTSHFVVEDTGLGITRTRKCVVIQLTTRPRDREAKESFYKLLCRELETTCGIPPSDVVVSMVTNSDEDWSFGNGRAAIPDGRACPRTEGGLTITTRLAQRFAPNIDRPETDDVGLERRDRIGRRRGQRLASGPVFSPLSH